MEDSARCGGRCGILLLVALTLVIGSLYSDRLFGRNWNRYVSSLSSLQLDAPPDIPPEELSQGQANVFKQDATMAPGTGDSPWQPAYVALASTRTWSTTGPPTSTTSSSQLLSENPLSELPTLPSWVNDLDVPRGKVPCPREIGVKTWNGRIGNHYFQVSQVIVFALLCGISAVSFPEAILNPKAYQSQVGVLLMPQRVMLEGQSHPQPLFVPSFCPSSFKSSNWYHQHCNGSVPAWRHWQVMQRYVRPHLGQQLLQIEAALTTAEEDVLTVHLRGDDVGRVPMYELSQPPCSLYQRILQEHRYRRVMLIFLGKPACQSFFEQNLSKDIQVERPKNNSVTLHFASLMRARHLLVSFSSFSLSAALLSKTVKTLYRRTGVPWEKDLHALLNCNIWPGVIMYEYHASIVPLNTLPPGGPSRWLKHFPGDNFTGPFLCEHGKDPSIATPPTTPTSPSLRGQTGITTSGGASTSTSRAPNDDSVTTFTTTTTTTTATATIPAAMEVQLDTGNVSTGPALPPLGTLSDEPLPRTNVKCPEEVVLRDWNGRIGNHFFQISQAIVFALLCGTPIVTFPAFIPRLYQSQAGMLRMPQRVVLQGLPLKAGGSIPEACPTRGSNWYHQHCRGIPSWRHRQVMAQFLRPNLGEKLLSAETAVEEHSKEMLTVHLRGEDIHVKPQYEVNQPPCSMYKKILSEHEYQSVMVVQVGTTACDDYFKELRKVITVHKPNTGSVVKDFAQLMRARNLALSFSSFALSAALLSKDVEVLYRRRDAEWESVLHSILNCNVWPGVKMYEYNTTMAQRGKLPKGPMEWLKSVAVEDISGPFICQYGSEIRPAI
ncbi:unnamed protein product [Durusdinium trenchii]|uniref:Uncharacterized protein n=2 Tax=Durusdinium trenchii TaxID=1381693 RepID=A0ABP0R441_9DINO